MLINLNTIGIMKFGLSLEKCAAASAHNDKPTKMSPEDAKISAFFGISDLFLANRNSVNAR